MTIALLQFHNFNAAPQFSDAVVMGSGLRLIATTHKEING